MYFKPAGEVLGDIHPIRTVTISDDRRLPDGEYKFVEHYCTDKDCDCRKTIIRVFHEDRCVSTVDYGWEDPKFYLKWLKSTKDKEMAQEMSGLSIDFMSPDLVSPEAILALVEHLMDEKWLAMIKESYRLVREAENENVIRFEPKISRNAPCPCGSGKKYKQCCMAN